VLAGEFGAASGMRGEIPPDIRLMIWTGATKRLGPAAALHATIVPRADGDSAGHTGTAMDGPSEAPLK